MHTLFVFDHPYGAAAHSNEKHNRSFSAALLHSAAQGVARGGGTADIIDLAADDFDPRMSRTDLVAWRRDEATDPLVLDYQRRLAAADHLVFVHPLWWATAPAGTKGFIDRVLTPGFAYSQAGPFSPLKRRLHRLQRVTVLSPHTTPRPLYSLLFGAPSARALGRATFRLIGIPRFTWRGFANVARKTPASRARILSSVERRFSRL